MNEGDIVENVHVGEVLRAWCKTHNLTRLKLAERLNLPKSNIDRMFSKPTIDTFKLVDLSHNLQYNFFAGIWGSRYFVDSDTAVEYLSTPPAYIHIGNIIEICLRENNISQNQLAAHLGVQHPVVSKLLRKESIDSGRLVIISNFLKHDFFAEFYTYFSDVRENYFPRNKVRESLKTIEPKESYKAILKRNEELVAENTRLKYSMRHLKDIYSQIQKFKEDNGVSEDWDSLVKMEDADIRIMVGFLLMEDSIKKILDESDQTDSSNKPDKD